jgi:hypothetical protein
MDKWSESVMENIDDYDEVFEELFDKYNDKVSMPPEMKLLSLVVGSAAMHHFSNSIFKSAVPGLNDILRSNPDLMRNISEAALNTPQMQQNPLGSFMMRQGMNTYANQMEQRQQQQQQPQYNSPPPTQQQQQQQQQGRRMRGPSEDVSDILNMLPNQSNSSTRDPMSPPNLPMMMNPTVQKRDSDTESIISVTERRTRKKPSNKSQPIQLHF